MNVNQIPSFVFRRRAWTAIRPLMSVLIVVALLSVLPGLINTTATLLTKADPYGYIEGPLEELTELSEEIDPEAEMLTPSQTSRMARGLQEYLEAFDLWIQEKGAIFFGLMGMELLLTPMLMVPVYGALLKALRGQSVSIGGSLALLRHGPKALVLFLWMLLRIYAWMLPGMGLLLVGVFLPQTMSVMLLLGSGVMLVLGFRAALHYILAPIVMVDDPALSLNGCIRRSWEEMRRRKMEYFCLRISFAGWMLLSALIGTLVMGMLGNVLGQAVSMLVELLLTVYINAAVVAFYDAYVVRHELEGGTPYTPPTAAAGEDGLN